MKSMLSLLFILVLMNASDGAAMEPERRSPTTKASRSRQSRGTRVVAKFIEQPDSIPIKKSGPPRAPSTNDLSRQNKLEDFKSDQQVVDYQEFQRWKMRNALEASKSHKHVDEYQDFRRWKILMQAINTGDLDVAAELFQSKDVLKYLNYRDAEYNTPLLCAVFMSNQGDETQRKGNYLIVQKLLENKADVNPWFNRPMQVAQLMGDKNIIQLLLSYEAKVHACTHTIEVNPEELDQVHNYMGSVRMVRHNWQCECGLCAYVLQGEHVADSQVKSMGYVRSDLGLTPEEYSEITKKEVEERKKRWARFLQAQSLELRDRRGNYSDPINPNPTRTFDALMKPK